MASRHHYLDRIDEMIRQLDETIETPQGLLREHLTGARAYLMNSMPDEFNLQIALARESLHLLEPAALRSQVDQLLQDLAKSSADAPN